MHISFNLIVNPLLWILLNTSVQSKLISLFFLVNFLFLHTLKKTECFQILPNPSISSTWKRNTLSQVPLCIGHCHYLKDKDIKFMNCRDSCLPIARERDHLFCLLSHLKVLLHPSDSFRVPRAGHEELSPKCFQLYDNL